MTEPSVPQSAGPTSERKRGVAVSVGIDPNSDDLSFESGERAAGRQVKPGWDEECADGGDGRSRSPIERSQSVIMAITGVPP
jgi:hypothetical protein